MSREKIVSPDALEERLRSEPRAREGLVLANGLFDLLHVGHVRYLEGARAQGSALLVAVNSDDSARRLKGSGRPVVALDERLEMLAALACVDWVTWFEEDNVERILRSVRPAVHAKGTDYTEDSVPERAVARELGIRTAIVGDPKGHASSDVIRRIRATSAEASGDVHEPRRR